MAADDNLLQRAGQWIREIIAPAIRPVREMIGRYVLATNTTRYKSYRTTIDKTKPDYEFWDKFRRGKTSGYSLGSLFAKRIERIFSRWVFAKGLEVTLSEQQSIEYDEDAQQYTEERLASFVNRLLDAGQAGTAELDDRDEGATSMLMQVYGDHLGLGDQYVIVNGDGSLSVPSPDTVTVERDEMDYRQVTAVEIENRLNGYTIIDRYEPDERTLTVKKGNRVEAEETYANLLGVIPVVHIAHDRSGNETHGHPIHEPLLPLCDEYDDVIYKQLGGAKLLGNPVPTVEGVENPAKIVEQLAPAEDATYADRNGNTETRSQVRLDQNPLVVLGKGGSFKFAAPPVGFTEDTKQSLKSLFLLLLDHTGIPEFIWGNELSSARASAETQMDMWVEDIEGLQRLAGGWILRLCLLWLHTEALTDRRLVVAPLQITWPPLREKDDALRLEQVKFAEDRELVTGETALRLLDLVDNPTQESEDAYEEAMERYERQFPMGSTYDFRADLEAAEREEGD